MDTTLNSLENVKKHRVYVYKLTKVTVHGFSEFFSLKSSLRGEGTRLSCTRMSEWLLHLPQLTELWLF